MLNISSERLINVLMKSFRFKNIDEVFNGLGLISFGIVK